jgi:hypothetical protein
MRTVRVLFIGAAIACGVTGLTLSGLVFALGSILLVLWDEPS